MGPTDPHLYHHSKNSNNSLAKLTPIHLRSNRTRLLLFVYRKRVQGVKSFRLVRDHTSRCFAYITPLVYQSFVHRPRTNASSKENLEELDDPYQSY